jgi:hypothetical protein
VESVANPPFFFGLKSYGVHARQTLELDVEPRGRDLSIAMAGRPSFASDYYKRQRSQVPEPKPCS